MSETGPFSINQDSARCDGQLRNELQIISMVLYLVNPELSTDPIRVRSFVQRGQSALGRVANILDSCAPPSVSNNPKIVVLKPRAANFTV
jgi:hypothetical protein